MSSEAITELNGFMQQAKNPQVQALLANCISQLQAAAKVEQPTSVESQRMYTDISQYAWDQSPKSVKIYFTVPSVNDTPLSDIELKAAGRSVDFRASNGLRFYKLSINPLSKDIDGSACTYKLKTGGAVVLTLPKTSTDTWSELKEKASSLKAPSFDSEGDPQTNLMKMMKDMYNDGDDEMKRTIAKAWTDGQEKRGMDGMNL
mmetsp:Transcript_17689/g.27709  ORF Transcript_17689/g.27709 Transcript_17689/m.27709 type:complete len:203 (-) Transcript_17689:53-661(-)|eukprot:CAMPEP_0201521644 /NCGR_PEP_ID=MMETSP0161_2-20130828/15395_1 /ASSEMBLY_ACC=CAM_ASM_000251 /TAXON_ID=180227 /ORGANISM="Neoparamoeba aestuarina, Strain SoJaBio B1-5/56/2" /LENGTH=202 /DNA_ID=CAMNT_0047920311 /DNA_START=36 /DNA_END=644 /DNA_ORIENTATION=+